MSGTFRPVVTLHADGVLGEGVSCSISTGRALVEAGFEPGCSQEPSG